MHIEPSCLLNDTWEVSDRIPSEYRFGWPLFNRDSEIKYPETLFATNDLERGLDHWKEPEKKQVGNIPKVGRNDPCPCGSGKKYKKCHGR